MLATLVDKILANHASFLPKPQIPLEPEKFEPEVVIDQVLAQDLDALITTEIPSVMLEGILRSGLPVICLAEVLKIAHPRLTILAEMDLGGYLAGEYIAKKLNGNGRVLIITAAKMQIQSVGQGRLRGFLAAMAAAPGIQVEHIPCYWTYPETYQEMRRVLQNRTEAIDAIFGASDTILFAARDACLELGKIAEHTLLVGLNGDPLGLAAVADGLIHATIDMGAEDVGAAAFEYAHQAASGKAIPKAIPEVFQLVTSDNVASVAARKLTSLANLSNHLVGYDRQKEHDRLMQLEAVAELSHQISAMLSQADLSMGIGAAVRRGFGYEWTRILRYDEGNRSLVYYGGDNSPVSACVPIPQDELLQYAASQSERVIIPDTHTSFRWRIGHEWDAIRSRAILPIWGGGKLMGLLDMQSSQPILQPCFESAGLKMLAEQIGIVVLNVDLYQAAIQAQERAEAFAAENSRLYAELVKLSLLDDLTGAFNRRGLMERGRNELSHARRLNYEVGILMFDLDNFKQINDSFGHGVGDHVLRVVVEAGQTNIREIDVLGRYGGDEFVIIMPGCNLDNARQMAERLRACVEGLKIVCEGNDLQTTISAGVTIYGNKEQTLEELLQKADQALYTAKQSGKNIVHY
jgi:diguanylate cyclase (GGDEF)-like protein